MGWYTDKPGNGMQPSNSSDNSTPVASPPTRRAVQIKERTNNDFTSEPFVTINDNDVTMRIGDAVCERTTHYLLLKRVKREVC